MRALDKKLLRDFKRLWPQAVAIALVLACGVATLIMAIGTYRSLTETRQAYYERYHFASIFATASRAPRSLLRDIGRISGVAAVEGRIDEPALLDMVGMSEPASGRVISIPDHSASRLNQLYLRSGHLPGPDKRSEAVVSEVFAKAHDLRVGSAFSGILAGHRITFRITGLALSPEFIYAIGPGDLVPDHRRFSAIWMRQKQVAGMLDLEDSFNSVSLTLLPGSSGQAVIEALDNLLAPYGGTGAYGRKDQTSHAFLDAELKGLRAMAAIIPPIFLFVSAFLINMILGRLIALEREQIGLLKALGYTRLAVSMHYVKLVLVIAVAGLAVGIAAGTWLGDGLTWIYAKFFNFPFLIFQRSFDIYVLAAGVSIAAALLGALKSVLSAAALPPATAMQPAAPAQYRKATRLGRMITGMMSQLTVMALRHLIRWPLRSGFSILGISLAVALVATAMFAFGAINFMVDTVYFRTDRQDATITFSAQLGTDAVYAVQQMPGVLSAEPFRVMMAELSHGAYHRRLAITGKPVNRRLSRILDLNLKPVSLPSSGLVLSERVAWYLKAKPGDIIRVKLLEEGGHEVAVPVIDVIQSYLGLGAYMDLKALDRLSRTGPRRSGAYVELDPKHHDAIYAAIKSMPRAASIGLQSISLEKFRETVEKNITIMTTVYVVLAIIVSFGVAYNSARILFSERARELASLRVLGFTRGEVSYVLFIELAVITLLAQPLGWLLGYGFSRAMVEGFQNDMFRLPFVVQASTYGWSSALVVLASLLSTFIVLYRVIHLDMIGVLKTKE